jgi:hypothetical protein
MKRAIIGAAVFLAVSLQGFPASAGIYTDDLSKCLVKSSTVADQTVLVQWIFATLSLNPAVKPLSSITAEQRDDLARKTSGIMQRLILSDCHTEAVAAFKYEGPAVALGASFQLLGQVAVRGLMSDPLVVAGMQQLDKFSDKSKWVEIYKEAGVPVPAPVQKSSSQ